MAVTGKSYVPITAGRRTCALPEVLYVQEASSVTALRGAPVVITAGYAYEIATNGTAIFGFLETAGQNKSADGLCKSRILRADTNTQFVGTLKATLTQAMIGSVANLYQGSSTWYLDTSTSVSSIAQAKILGPAGHFAVGDTNPEVIFVLDKDNIQLLA